MKRLMQITPLRATGTRLLPRRRGWRAATAQLAHGHEQADGLVGDLRHLRAADGDPISGHVGGIQPSPPPAGRPGDFTASTLIPSFASVRVMNALFASSSRNAGCARAGADCLPLFRNGRRQRFGAIQSLTGEAQKLNAAAVEDVILALHAGP
jgi:hypothetical protein